MILTTVGLYALLLQLAEGGVFRGSASNNSSNNREVVATSSDGLDEAERRLRLFDAANEDTVIADVVAVVSDGPAGYCNWGESGTAESSKCTTFPDAFHIQGGPYCSATQTQCEVGCSGNWCTNDSTRMLYCGIPNKCSSLGGNEVVASRSVSVADVRCCSTNASLGWPRKCNSIQGVYGESNVPKCFREKTFDEAVAICGAYEGGRLCSGVELMDKCTRGTGCGSNRKLVWGCASLGVACGANAECCGGFCSDGGVCEVYTSGTPGPTNAPTSKPTSVPTNEPSKNPTSPPTTSNPTDAPTNQPTDGPSNQPSRSPTLRPNTHMPTDAPTQQPTNAPSKQPSKFPTAQPISPEPTDSPTRQPTNAPSDQPSKKPTKTPTYQPTDGPTTKPSPIPTKLPTDQPTSPPSNSPTSKPSNSPSLKPTKTPTDAPTSEPTASPTSSPVPGPTPSFPYGNGPFVTLATSSDLVTIPRPPVPSSSGEPRSNCPHTKAGLLSWHDDATWLSGNVPLTGDDVTLPSNSKVIITQSVTQKLGLVTVPSTSELIFDENDDTPITLDIAGMDVRGALRAGSQTCRYLTELTITLHGSRPTDLNKYGTSSTAVPTYKGISVNGGIISMHGKQEYPTWSRLSESVPAGQSYLLVQEQVNWKAGQEIVLVTTAIHDSRAIHENEVLTISSIEHTPVPGVGSAIHFTAPAAHAHIANNGYQAEVGLLTRNIKVQGSASDSEPTDPDMGSCTGQWHFGTNFAPCPWKYKTGFGGHIMVHSGGRGYVEGVELYRMGQTNVLGRYPFHFHVLGNDCADCYFKGNSIHESYYRCISIHGTHGTKVTENVAYDVSGFCYYLEDGVEEDNEISFNLAAHIHPVSNVIANGDGGQTINPFSQSKDLILPADVTASGFYLTNLHNDIFGNAASGGWSGFAMPNLQSPIGAHRNVNMRPGNRLTKILDGNTAHSTGWWWSHAGAFYNGGTLYYSNADATLLEYNAGRDDNRRRSPCLVDKCVTTNNCNDWCSSGEQAWFQLTNSKVFLTASPGLTSWTGRAEVSYFEAHDVALGLEALESGFGIDNFLVECRSGEEWVMPGNMHDVTANGFFWYDTGQEHIITNAKFKNCGARNNDNVYDSSPTRGCDTNSGNGCNSGSSVWSFLTHSDQFTPEIMQATASITYENCGRRFRLYDYVNDPISTVSGRNQNWLDTDGSATGLNEPTIIGSGLADAGRWWHVDDDVVEDPEGPLKFIKVNDGPSRGLGHIRLFFKEELHNTVGGSSCKNGPKEDGAGGLYCPAVGKIRHIGSLFDSSNDPTGGLPITANSEVAGLVGGFGWVLQLDDGPPKDLKIDQVEVDSTTPLMLVIPYPQETAFTITAHGVYCTPSSTHSCTEQFALVDSVAHVRHSQGNTYYFDTTTNLLYVRIIQFPETFTGDDVYSSTAMWHLWDLDTPNTKSWDPNPYALDRYSFNGITLPKFAYGNYLQITADCVESSVSGHCAVTPTYVEPEVCPTGYIQVSYDKCCTSAASTDCYDMTAPPTKSPTASPTFGSNSNLVLNPGFENDSNGLANWYANSGTAEINTAEKHSGDRSVLCKDRTATWMGVQQSMIGRLQADTRYHVSCWAKLRNAGSATLMLSLRIDDDNGPHWRSVSGNINNISWTKVEGEIFVGVTGTLTNIYMYAEGPATGVEYWVDDFSAVSVP